MININATGFRKDLFSMLDQTIKYNEQINISTKSGNAILLSEEDYNGIMETLYLASIPGMRDRLIEGRDAELEDCVPEDEVKW